MAEVQIAEQHRAWLASRQHVLVFLQGERALLEAKLRHTMEQGERVQRELMEFLHRDYGITAVTALDAERGVITVPDMPTAPAPTVADVLKAEEQSD